MFEFANRTNLPLESSFLGWNSPRGAGQDLHSNFFVEVLVSGEHHVAHAALADGANELVRTDLA